MMDLGHGEEKGVFRNCQPLVLASGSPRRRALLAASGMAFEIVPSPAEEPDPEPGEQPGAYAERAAAAKAVAVASLVPDAVVLGADTVVVAPDGQILGKPADEAHARAMVATLCGGERRTHHVVTGCCVVFPRQDGAPGEQRLFHANTAVTLAAQNDATIAAYVATGESMDKAGAYAIQGKGAFLVEHVEGSYTNVVGLPLARVLDVLLSVRVIIPREG